MPLHGYVFPKAKHCSRAVNSQPSCRPRNSQSSALTMSPELNFSEFFKLRVYPQKTSSASSLGFSRSLDPSKLVPGLISGPQIEFQKVTAVGYFSKSRIQSLSKHNEALAMKFDRKVDLILLSGGKFQVPKIDKANRITIPREHEFSYVFARPKKLN